MRINKCSNSEKSSESTSVKSGCGCTKKGASAGSEEEIDIKISK